MKHIDEITLELYILKSPKVETEIADITAHLADCHGCRELHDTMAEFYSDLKRELNGSESLPVLHSDQISMKPLTSIERQYQNLSPIHRFAVGVPLRMARWVFHHPYIAAGSTVFFSSLIIAGLINFFKPAETKPRDLNPTNAAYGGEMMFIRNSKGDTLNEILVGTQYVNMMKSYLERGASPLVHFYDVNKDGVNEVIYGLQPSQLTKNNSIIFCKSIKEDTILWRDTLRQKLVFPNKPDVQDDHFLCAKIIVDDFENNGAPVVMIQARHGFFPTLIVKLDAQTGHDISHYVHIGGLETMEANDLDQDGITEILLSGSNNAFGNACLVVLDPRFCSGHSPTTEEYQIVNIEPARERAYILFPRSIIGQTERSTTSWNQANDISQFHDDNKTFRVRVDDPIKYSDLKASFYITFGYDLVPQAVGTSDLFDVTAKKFFRTGVINQLPGPTYWTQYLKTLRYWNGVTWQNQPVQNRIFLQSIAHLK